jgi:hypothetical protein
MGPSAVLDDAGSLAPTGIRHVWRYTSSILYVFMMPSVFNNRDLIFF